MTKANRGAALLGLWLGLALVAGCATPIGVERADPKSVHRQLTSNILSTGELSDFTQNALRVTGLDELALEDPEAALAAGHALFTGGVAGVPALFALSEFAFKHAADGGGQPYYLASAVYAFAFLFPEEGEEVPSPFDPRFRWATDIYNLAITRAFETRDGRVELASGVHALPFGQIEVTFDSDDLLWGRMRFTEFAPAADYQVRGLRNRYRRPGLGAPLAAAMVPLEAIEGFQVARNLREPVTATLRIDDARRSLTDGRLTARLELHTPDAGEEITVAGRTVPLEVEPSTSLALGLEGSPIWATRFQGLLRGDLFKDAPTQLAALQPHRPGQIPVVLVHGTASNPATWAGLVNDLTSDPRIRESFSFWFFTYETGNPIPYSALRLRRALAEAVTTLDPEGEDGALREMVVIGHSQGGLLTKLIAVDTGSRFWDAFSAVPLEELRLQEETRELLREAMFIEPSPSVGRVVFIATPHRGSYLTEYSVVGLLARGVRLPLTLARATGDILTANPDALRFDPRRTRIGSLYGMTPGNPGLMALSEIPIAPGIPAHSIVAVRGDGPLEDASDGVVEYRSAHIEGVESELIVRSGHSVISHPQAVLEVRRILLRHLEEHCPEIPGCASPALVAAR
jgi:pimeloyl-ACP methyl ester carboxylesterase